MANRIICKLPGIMRIFQALAAIELRDGVPLPPSGDYIVEIADACKMPPDVVVTVFETLGKWFAVSEEMPGLRSLPGMRNVGFAEAKDLLELARQLSSNEPITHDTFVDHARAFARAYSS